MQIQVNTDHNIEGHQAFTAQVSSVVENVLSRFSDSITQVDIHLSDENSNKKEGYEDMLCKLEAHLKGRQPIAVSHQSATIEQAVEGAASKLENSIESILGRIHDREKHTSAEPPASDT